VPREVAEAWLAYLREELPTVAFKCSTQKQTANLGQRRLPAAAAAERGLAGAECLGAETLLQLLKNYARSADRKTAITVGALCLRRSAPSKATSMAVEALGDLFLARPRRCLSAVLSRGLCIRRAVLCDAYDKLASNREVAK